MSGIMSLGKENRPKTAREQRVASRAFYIGYLLGVLAGAGAAVMAILT